jgi:hypothetical protein
VTRVSRVNARGVAYLAQAAVNIAQPMTTPILFVFIGVLISREQNLIPRQYQFAFLFDTLTALLT